MEGDRRLSLTVGGFTVAALAVLAVTILSLSAEQGIFQARYGLVAYFENVQGLVPGAAVRLAGTRVGQVEAVELSRRPGGEPAVKVDLRVDEGVRERLRSDSQARISTVGLLGDQIVELTIGSDEAAVLEPGAEIATLDPFDLAVMVSRGGSALEAIESLASNLNAALSDFQGAGGTAGLADAVNSVGEIVREIQRGDGVLHNLVYEPYQGSAISSLETTLDSVSNIMVAIETGDGIFHELIFAKPAEQDVVLQVLEAGAKLNSILDKMDRGEGTLGLLLNDPTLYEEVKLLVGGAQRSTVVRSLINLVTEGD